MIRRRYESVDKVRMTTYEVPASVISAIGQKKVEELLLKAQATYRSKARIEYVKKLLAEGWKPTAVAHEVGLTETRVRQIRKEMMDES